MGFCCRAERLGSTQYNKEKWKFKSKQNCAEEGEGLGRKRVCRWKITKRMEVILLNRPNRVLAEGRPKSLDITWEMAENEEFGQIWRVIRLRLEDSD